jgi:hypothetical protein
MGHAGRRNRWALAKALTRNGAAVRLNIMHVNQLHDALTRLTEAIKETESVLRSMRAEHDALAVHIFVSRRRYRNTPDTKGGKRAQTVARLTWQTASDLGFRGSLGEWERLISAAPAP